MRFVRAIPWLRSIFPPSERPMNDPSFLSDDVQLTHDYWGGGYAFREPQAWYSRVTIVKPADDSYLLLDLMPIGQTVRIISAGLRQQGGVSVLATVASLVSWAPDASIQVPITDLAQVIPAGVPASAVYRMSMHYPILLPGSSNLYIYFRTGDNVAYICDFLAVACPRGVPIIA